MARSKLPTLRKLSQDEDVAKAMEMFKTFVDLREADKHFPVRSNAVYTTSVLLWMQIFQRMLPDTTMESVVKKLVETQPLLLPNNKRIREGNLSTNTSTYSLARKRMGSEPISWVATNLSRGLINSTEPSFQGRRVFIIDGTTIKLAPVPELQEAFPPASNQHGKGVFPIANTVVAHELASGAALIPALGAMYGKNAQSETALVQPLFDQMPPNSIVMADAGFGIFAVAHRAFRSGHSFVFRLTKQRFTSLKNKAKIIQRSPQIKTYSLEWSPSAREVKKHPDITKESVLDVRLHEVTVSPKLTLYLVTDSQEESQKIANLYQHRYSVELDIRNFKVVLDAENIRARSLNTFYQEFLGSVIAYNLVCQFRRQVAIKAKVPPRGLSFKKTLTTFRQFLIPAIYSEPASWGERYGLALAVGMKDKLPNRPGRSFAREAYQSRPKSSKFKKRTQKKKPT